MLRTIGGVILGFVTMAVIVFVSLTVAYLAMGADGAFKPGGYEVTSAWLVVMFFVSFAAAVAGGLVASLVGRNAKVVLGLAGLVFVLGLLSAIPSLAAAKGEPKVRTGQVSNSEAMMNAKQPPWVALLMPVIGVAGVLLAGDSAKARPEIEPVVGEIAGCSKTPPASN